MFIIFNEEIIDLQIAGLHTPDEILSYLSEQLFHKGIVKDSFKKAVLEREKIYPTGLPFSEYGVAIPHADSEHVQMSQLAILTLAEPVPFAQMANPDELVEVDIVIMLAIKEAHSQVEILQKLMAFIQNKEAMMALKHLSKEDKEKVVAAAKTYGLI